MKTYTATCDRCGPRNVRGAARGPRPGADMQRLQVACQVWRGASLFRPRLPAAARLTIL